MVGRRGRFYYGWVIVGVAFLGSGIGSGVSLWGASVFVIPMTEDLGWSRAAFFSGYTVRAAVVGVLAPVVGPWTDTRAGPRALAAGGAVLLGLSLVLLRYTDSLWQFLLLFGVAGGLADLGSGFMVAQTLVPKWFVRRRGRALGIAIAGVGIGATVFPGAVSALVETVGWRDAWLWLGIGAGGVSLALALLIRTRPEDMGLLPDGAAAGSPVPENNRREERSLTRAEALRTPAFWLLMASFALAGFGIMGFQSNWVPFLLERDFSAAQASFGILFYGVISGLSRPVWGLISERVAPRFLMAAVTGVTGFSILAFLEVRSLAPLVAYMSVAGVVMGGYLILQSLLTADYFGRAHLGAVAGLMRPVGMVTGAVSPLIIGALYDLHGGYTIAFLVAAAAWLGSGAIALATKPPRPRAERART